MKLTRRHFLQKSVAGLLSGSGAAAALNTLALTNAYAQDASDYRSLVCIFLYGGNDSFNMFVPRNEPQYSSYQNSRRNLAVERDQLLGVGPVATDGSQYGFHPAMPDVRSLFNEGNMAVVGNVGPLMVPTTRDEYRNRRVPLPPRLFSHNDQQDFWQSLDPGTSRPSGWAGRMADAMNWINTNQELSMNISMSGTNLMQTGRSEIPYILSNQGVVDPKSKTVLTGYGRLERRNTAMDTILGQDAGHIFGNEYRKVMRRAFDLGDQIGNVLDSMAQPVTLYPGSPIGKSLNMVARMIAAREQLGLSRQVFFVGFGGWDTHGNQASRHPALLSGLSRAMHSFYRTTEELGIADSVTTFTAADFGRTLTSNGDGSDHGWGGHQLVMGGSVRGNAIYGQMPAYDIEGPSDSGRGRIIPTTSVDQFGATLANWFGLSDGSLQDVFPNLGNFDQRNLGFIG